MIKIKLILLLIFILTSTQALAFREVHVSWDHDSEDGEMEFRIYYGVTEGIFTDFVTTTEKKGVVDLNSCIPYHFVVTAVNKEGLESDPSESVTSVGWVSDTPEAKQKVDVDQDGIDDRTDNCPNVASCNQSDQDNDGVGDICDNAPNVYNPSQADEDNDGIPDVYDFDYLIPSARRYFPLDNRNMFSSYLHIYSYFTFIRLEQLVYYEKYEYALLVLRRYMQIVEILQSRNYPGFEWGVHNDKQFFPIIAQLLSLLEEKTSVLSLKKYTPYVENSLKITVEKLDLTDGTINPIVQTAHAINVIKISWEGEGLLQFSYDLTEGSWVTIEDAFASPYYLDIDGRAKYFRVKKF